MIHMNLGMEHPLNELVLCEVNAGISDVQRVRQLLLKKGFRIKRRLRHLCFFCHKFWVGRGQLILKCAAGDCIKSRPATTDKQHQNNQNNLKGSYILIKIF